MASSDLMGNYLGAGLLAARPVTPKVVSNATAIYFATDTTNLFVWDGAAWHQIF